MTTIAVGFDGDNAFLAADTRWTNADCSWVDDAHLSKVWPIGPKMLLASVGSSSGLLDLVRHLEATGPWDDVEAAAREIIRVLAPKRGPNRLDVHLLSYHKDGFLYVEVTGRKLKEADGHLDFDGSASNPFTDNLPEIPYVATGYDHPPGGRALYYMPGLDDAFHDEVLRLIEQQDVPMQAVAETVAREIAKRRVRSSPNLEIWSLTQGGIRTPTRIDKDGAWGYTGNVKRAGFGTDGRFMAGAGKVVADEDGIRIVSPDGNTTFNGDRWEVSDGNVVRVRIGRLD